MESTKRSVIVGSLNGAPQDLDPAAIIDSSQWHTLVNLGINLVAHDKEGRLVGEAARSWEVSDGLRTFSFNLLDGIKDSDGTPLDSRDWRASFEHLLRSGGSTHSFIAEYLEAGGIETPSPSRFVLHLKKPYETFIQRLTTPEFILIPRRAISQDNRVDFRIASGAYRLKGFDKAKRTCTLIANPHYFHTRPGQIQEVILEQEAPSNAELFRRLSQGEWNFSIAALLATDPAKTVLSRALENKSVRLVKTQPSSVGYVLLVDSPRLTTIEQRLSLAKLIGEHAEQEMTGLSGYSAHQFYPAGSVGALPPPREKALFDEISKRGRLDTLPKKLIGYGTSGAYAAGTAQWFEKILKNAGVAVQMERVNYTDYVAKYRQRDHDFLVSVTGVNAKDPAGSLITKISPKGGIVPDPEGKLNRLLKDAVEAPMNERAAILHRLSEMLVRDAHLVPFLHYGTSIVSSADIVAEPPSAYDDEIRLADIRWSN